MRLGKEYFPFESQVVCAPFEAVTVAPGMTALLRAFFTYPETENVGAIDRSENINEKVTLTWRRFNTVPLRNIK